MESETIYTELSFRVCVCVGGGGGGVLNLDVSGLLAACHNNVTNLCYNSSLSCQFPIAYSNFQAVL